MQAQDASGFLVGINGIEQRVNRAFDYLNVR